MADMSLSPMASRLSNGRSAPRAAEVRPHGPDVSWPVREMLAPRAAEGCLFVTDLRQPAGNCGRLRQK
jgi:hypothetical protein